jgi:hypothetical protein
MIKPSIPSWKLLVEALGGRESRESSKQVSPEYLKSTDFNFFGENRRAVIQPN